MPWNIVSVGSSLEKLQSEATELLNELQEQLDKATVSLGSAQAQVSSVSALLSQNNAVIDSLSKDGIYGIVFQPGFGTWPSRLSSSQNSPRQVASDYSALFASIAVAPSYQALLSVYSAIKGTLGQGLKNLVSIPDIIANFPVTVTDLIIEPDLSDIGNPISDTNINKWQTIQLKNLFPNVFNKLKAKNRDLVKLNDTASRMVSFSQSLVNQLTIARNAIQQIITDLSSASISEVLLLPDSGQTWLDRMINEPDAPSTALEFSCGVCFVSIGTNLSEVQDKYNTILSVMKN